MRTFNLRKIDKKLFKDKFNGSKFWFYLTPISIIGSVIPHNAPTTINPMYYNFSIYILNQINFIFYLIC